jgi:Lysylphosphatidylglycerol synthase TM region
MNIARVSLDRVGAAARRAAPWTIAAAILWWLFDRVPIADAWGAATEAQLFEFTLVTAVLVTAWWLIESRAFAYLFTRFNAPVSWSEALALRGLTYLATPINWNLGTAAIVLHLRRSKGIGAVQSTSSMIFYQTIDLMVLATLALAGSTALPTSPSIVQIQRAAAIADGFAIAQLAVFMTSRPRWTWLQRLRAIGIFSTHQQASLANLGFLAAVRTCYFGGFVLYFWLGTWAFHASVPLFFAMAVTPIVLVVASLPITPAGLGTAQATMLYFFAPYGTEAAILAFALAYPVALTCARLPIGLLYVRDLAALRESRRQVPREPASASETELSRID